MTPGTAESLTGSLTGPLQAVLAFGSNLAGDLGDPEEQIRRAAATVAAQPGVTVTGASALYATAPWGVTDQAEFRNSVLLVEVDGRVGGPLGLLHLCQAREQEARRVRDRHWGPRTLDIDLVSVSVDGVPVRSDGRWGEELVVPHAWAHARAFVLVPWQDADPSSTLGGTPLADLIAACPEEDVSGVRALPDVAWAP
jgi:2-amino-4-hydroxy-6-hydroxymethyldihydropteridine diphosphokinase